MIELIAYDVKCPLCEAEAGRSCVDIGGEKQHPHLTRANAAVQDDSLEVWKHL